MSMTMVPVTTGGSIHSIHLMPLARTIKPTRASTTPVTTTPPSAAAGPPLALAAAIGAKKAKEEPK